MSQLIDGLYVGDMVIPNDAWEPTGDYLDDARARLTCHIRLECGGIKLPMHLEAYAIKGDSEDGVELLDEDADFGLSKIVGDGGWPPTLTTIEGREYALIATPFGS